jgi:hypothetical protein
MNEDAMISRENFRFAAAFAALSGVLHIAAPVVSGFASEAWLVVPFGVIYLILAYGLFMGWRWLAWLAFFWSFAGVAGAISQIWTQGVLPGWLFQAILAANVLAVLGLFVALWRAPPPREI